jgi:hypothetical protein
LRQGVKPKGRALPACENAEISQTNSRKKEAPMNDNINEHLTAGPAPLSLQLSPQIHDHVAPADLAFLRAQLAHLDSLGKTPATGDTIFLPEQNLRFSVVRRHWQLHHGHSQILLCLALSSELET